MPENIVTTKLQMTTDGTAEAAQDYDLLQASAEKTAAAIQQANDAAQGLNSTIADFAPLQQGGAEFWSPENQKQFKQAGKDAKETAGAMGNLGEAGQQLKGILDSVVPGFGGIFESLTSLNPIAIAGTVALTGAALAFGDLQQKADAARKAIEEEVAARSQAAYDQMELNQRVNAALAGDTTARENIIKEYAATNAEAARLAAQRDQIENDRLANQKIVDEQQKIASEALARGDLDAAEAALKLRDTASVTLDGIKKSAEELKPKIDANNTAMSQLKEATEQLSISQAELNAVTLSGAQGVEGAANALDKLWGSLDTVKDTFEKVGGGLFDALKKSAEDTAKGVANTLADAAKAREDAEKRLVDINEDLAGVEAERGKVEADRVIEAQRAAEMGALETRLAAAQEYDARVQKNLKLKQIQDEANTADVSAQQKFFEGQQKLLSNYLKAEQTATEDYSRDRVRKLEDLYNTLNDLASQRDVAGFVNARRSGMTDIGRMDEDAGTAARRRREQYDQAAQDQIAAYQKENAQRREQLQQRLEQERNAGQQVVSQAAIVQKQIADLRARYAEQDLRARRMQEDATYRQTVDILMKKRNDELKITAGAAAGVIDFISRIGQAATKLKSFGSNLLQRGTVPSYDVGTDFVPNNQFAYLHRGERVMTAAENAQYMRSSGGRQMGNVVIQNLNVGKIATPDDIAAVKSEIVGAITSYGANANI